ncbi:MAG: NUDIX domain-containing protein [Candidatus Bathyarchaeota archaeon]|nr:MAG: NUDIX domain-containing protein [Candidatus Bathyarchaeota archaeon]
MKPFVDTVAFIVHRDGRILVEKRKSTKETDPGKIAIPGGHVEDGESLEQACARELKEELGLECNEFRFITKFLHYTGVEDQMIHFYSCEGWRGEAASMEAEDVIWVSLEDIGLLDFDVDRKATAEYIRKQWLKERNDSIG